MILDRIEYPQDIKNLSIAQLKELCSDIREYMVECCSRNPGHLASSLGAVEIIVGMHYVFDAPEDKFIFDVGHQAYAHKILTGRREAFLGNRTEGGISGFPKRSESPYDAFGVGHSSTSISAALGFAEASRIRGTGEKVVALIGDGALTGGLAFEGLNNAGNSKSDLLIILNDNNQSIDGNIGGLHNHLLNITTNPAYNQLKDKIWHSIGENRTRNFIQRKLRSLKSMFVDRTGGALFESLGLRYFGPIDGNDLEAVISALKKIKGLKGPRVLHCYSIKGKGYAPAEADPTTWHAPGRFNPKTGERVPSAYSASRYQDVFGKVLMDLAAKDERIVGITPAMASGCGMTAFGKAFPERFFDVGIEEEHAVTFAAGLAANGMRPFCNIYSAFSQRAYDQIIHDVALQGLPVVLCFDRAGLVGEDGATHNGVFDLSAYRSVPGITIMTPSDELELKNAMYSAIEYGGPVIIRYPRGTGEGVEWENAEPSILPLGKARCIQKGESDLAILAAGPVASTAIKASGEFDGPSPWIYDMRFVKPLDTEVIDFVASSCKNILTIEDGTLKGGLLGAVSEYLCSRAPGVRIEGIGVPDRFILHARQDKQRALCGFDAEGILSKIRELSQKK